jgi:hypothetical protein
MALGAAHRMQEFCPPFGAASNEPNLMLRHVFLQNILPNKGW